MNAAKISKKANFDLNPRGNLWMDDESRLGLKLLSKMGWSQGKGLGKNETGITENLKIRMKIGNTGVGWEEKLPWQIDTHDLDGVLDNLNKKFHKPNGGEVKNDNLKSIEKRSHKFKNRLHYKKFLQGKDVCRYSDKDMNGIFVSKALKSDMKSVPEETTVTNVNNLSDDDSTNDSIHIFKSKLSMTDYFAQKLKNELGEIPKANINSEEEPQNIETLSRTESQITCRKRKKELKSSKKAKKSRLSDLEIINNAEKNSSSEEVLDENMVEEYSSEICNNKIFKKAKLSHKKSKKVLKNKVQVLKSCLKNSAVFWLDNKEKKVSFNDNVSYKIIEGRIIDELDTESPQNDEGTETFEEFLNFNLNGNESESTEDEKESTEDEKESTEDEKESTEDDKESTEDEKESTEDEKESRETETCDIFNADSTSSELENSELLNNSSQCRQLNNLMLNIMEGDVEEDPGNGYNKREFKMRKKMLKEEMCDSVLKQIKIHPVLQKTNLLEIKGYGNWGILNK